MTTWINPRYTSAIAANPHLSDALTNGTPIAMGNCSNCGGTGRIIYIDPSDGTMRDIPCGACGGSGQTS